MNRPVDISYDTSPKLSAQLAQLWPLLQREVQEEITREPILSEFLMPTVLDHSTFNGALSAVLAQKLSCPTLSQLSLRKLCLESYEADPTIVTSALLDLIAVTERDPACKRISVPFLYYKGFQGLQLYRIANWLWKNNRRALARYIQSRVSEVFAIDIHPAAKVGNGILIDHATSIVIGETAVVGNNVSMLHEVTLGGTGKETGDRHPKIAGGVLIGAGAKVLGNVYVGEGAKIGAGSVVLNDVTAHCTVAGVPAIPVGQCGSVLPAHDMDHSLETGE
ncbi:MAG: serine O-acetyltransferase [Acidiferrobacterales bacterium]|nr:serine O-acetyltransferase [Acidiferrobacterales bacterium]